jgi:hypothetical protein
MSALPSKIFTAQEHLAALINADARPVNVLEINWPRVFNDPADAADDRIEAITQRKGEIDVFVAQKLQSTGAGVIVMLPLITFPENTTWRVSVGLKFAVIVTENPIVNETGKSAEAMVERILLLVHFKPNGVAPNDRTRAGLFTIDRNAVRIMEPTTGSESLLNYTIAVNTDITL